MLNKEGSPRRTHYSDKGGHYKRSLFHKEQRRVPKQLERLQQKGELIPFVPVLLIGSEVFQERDTRED